MTTFVGIFMFVLAVIGGNTVLDWIVGFFKNRKNKSSK